MDAAAWLYGAKKVDTSEVRITELPIVRWINEGSL